jgi:hypothetical protein
MVTWPQLVQWMQRWCFAGVVLASLAALRRHHHQHCAVIVAAVAPTSLPLLHGHFCPRRAGIVALVAFALLPASQTGVCLVTKQS